MQQQLIDETPTRMIPYQAVVGEALAVPAFRAFYVKEVAELALLGPVQISRGALPVGMKGRSVFAWKRVNGRFHWTNTVHLPEGELDALILAEELSHLALIARGFPVIMYKHTPTDRERGIAEVLQSALEDAEIYLALEDYGFDVAAHVQRETDSVLADLNDATVPTDRLDRLHWSLNLLGDVLARRSVGLDDGPMPRAMKQIDRRIAQDADVLLRIVKNTRAASAQAIHLRIIETVSRRWQLGWIPHMFSRAPGGGLLDLAPVQSRPQKVSASGATWASFATIAPSGDCAVDIGVPYASNASESVIYYVKSGSVVTTTYDFSLGQQGWTLEYNTGNTPPGNEGIYASGAFRGTDQTQDSGAHYRNVLGVLSLVAAAPFSVSSITLTFDRAVAGDLSGGKSAVQIEGLIGGSIVGGVYTGGSTVFNQQTNDTSGSIVGTGLTYSWTGSATIDCIRVAFENGQQTFTPTGGSVALYKIVATSPQSGTRDLYKNNTQVSPIAGYAPWKSTPQISICLQNSNLIAVAAGDATETNAGLFVTQNGGTTWTPLIAPTTDGSSGRAEWSGFSGKGTNPPIYVMGTKGFIQYGSTPNGPLVDKRGVMTSSAAVVGIAGMA